MARPRSSRLPIAKHPPAQRPSAPDRLPGHASRAGGYDLASLLYNPYVSLPESERADLIRFYQNSAEKNDPDFDEKLQLCAMQRLMQALGAYGYLGLAKGHKAFLALTPSALAALGQILATMPRLEPLRRVVVAGGVDPGR